MIIAVDGPAASGKGTIAKALAVHFGLPFLDTGMLYRAVGVATLRAGGDPACSADALSACSFSDELLSDPELRGEISSQAASQASVHPAVRTALLDRQRAFAGQVGGAVLDGRDIGTVIAPDADAKLFVTASPEVRARRRTLDVHEDYDVVLSDIQARDMRDSGRSVAPLRQADDADLLDTTNLTIDAAIQRAIALVEARIRR
jgi:CMP/dCMP kinase